MDIFDKIGDTIISATKEVGQKAKDVTEITKLQCSKREKEIELKEKYMELGEKYFQEHKEEEELADIKILVEEIEELKQEIMDIKGSQFCPQCGMKLDEKALFCSKCGTKVNDIFEEE